jgi:hypothetical protein
MGSSFTMTYTVDLATAPFDSNTDFATWRPESCIFTINGQTYTGDPNYSDFIQNKGTTYWPEGPHTVLRCEDPSAGHLLDLAFTKTSGFNNVGVAERLDLPAVLMEGHVDGEFAVAPVNVTEVGETESGVVTYNISGTTNMGSSITMTYTVDLTKAPFDSNTDFAFWRPERCSFTINGQTYTGDPNNSDFVQDKGTYWPEGPYTALHCFSVAYGHSFDLKFAKTSGFNNVGVAEKVDLPAMLLSSYIDGENAVAPVNVDSE